MKRKEKLLYVKYVLGWTADENGNVYGKNGKKIGSKNTRGYMKSTIKYKKNYYHIALHQFVWFYLKDEQIVEYLDHINGDKTDNRISNLRSVTFQQNTFNRVGSKGYFYRKRTNRYEAKIVLNYQTIYLGSYKTAEEARNAYLEAKKIYHII